MRFVKSSLASLATTCFLFLAGCVTDAGDQSDIALAATNPVVESAQTTKVDKSDELQKSSVVKDDPSEIICKIVKKTGSRLSQKKICSTREKWAENEKLQQKAADDLNRQGHRRGS